MRLQCIHMYLEFCMDGLETLDHLEGVKLCSEQVSKPAGALEQLQQVKREHHPVTQGTVQRTVVEETTNIQTGTIQTAWEVMHSMALKDTHWRSDAHLL